MMFALLALTTTTLALAEGPEPFPIPGQDAVAYRNNCTTSCPLLIMFHGMGGDGQKFSEDSTMHDKFQGITAYPSSIPFATGWPVIPDTEYWNENLATVQHLMSMPEVDRSKVFILGFSSGGFYVEALKCSMGDKLNAGVVIAALKYIQPTCPYRTHVLHIHNLNDNYNRPIDPPNGTKPGGLIEIGEPSTLRSNWRDEAKYAKWSDNGKDGVKDEYFRLYSAQQGTGIGGPELTYDYYGYWGPAEHAYMVYKGVPEGAPDGLGMEAYITKYLEAHE